MQLIIYLRWSIQNNTFMYLTNKQHTYFLDDWGIESEVDVKDM